VEAGKGEWHQVNYTTIAANLNGDLIKVVFNNIYTKKDIHLVKSEQPLIARALEG
jgi:hypothetical protein